MADPVDVDAIIASGWRQGAILGPALARQAMNLAPGHVDIDGTQWLVVTSHDCDVVNPTAHEPFVEVLRFVSLGSLIADKMKAGGRNPRRLELHIPTQADDVLTSATVHDRWMIPRSWLASEPPCGCLDGKRTRLIAEWLAKRYIRAAFPSSFDVRWHAKLRNWTKLLARESAWITGVYLRLHTLTELPLDQAYAGAVLVVMRHDSADEPDWDEARRRIQRAIEQFWAQFEPGVEMEEVDVRGAHHVRLADLFGYQRFDADWVSFADDSPSLPLMVDLSG